MTEFAPRPPQVEARHLADDLLAMMRAIHRMRPELERQHAWEGAEAACQDLQRSRMRLLRKANEGTTDEEVRDVESVRAGG